MNTRSQRQITDNLLYRMNEMKGSDRSAWIDNIRLIATVAVIVVHVATPAIFFRYDPAELDNSIWWVGNIYGSFARFCVPLFLMITGTLLLSQNFTLKDFLKKRVTRILWPFILWSLIYILFNLALNIRDGERSFLNSFGSWLTLQVLNSPAVHLWYVYMIIGLYFFIPIIKPWVESASNNAILYFLGIWSITLAVGQQTLIQTETYFDFRYFGGYLGYLVLGYYISERVAMSRKVQNIGLTALALGFTVTFFGTALITIANGHFSHAFYEYLTINVLSLSIGMFITIKSLKVTGDYVVLNKLRRFVSQYGFGIYLSHSLILSVMAHFGLDYSLITPSVGIPICTLICFTVSSIVVYTLDKMPYGRYFH
jgi:surface polysaccharide O-acyltransferase-like enzyme